MAKLSRKELKRDEFREELAGSWSYLVRHRNTIVVLAVVAVVVGVGLAFYVGHRRTQRAEARKALQSGIELYHGQVNTEQRMGMIIFATTIERFNRTTEAFELIQRQFPGTAEAHTAEYYLALLDIEREQYQEAQQKLESAVQSGDEETQALARLALGQVYENLGKDAEAREQYQYVVDHPTTMVPKERAQLALARHLATREPERAKEILDELIQRPGPLGGAATVTLRDLPGS